MKKHKRLLVLLVLSLGCTSAKAVEHYSTGADSVIDNFTGLEWQRNAGAVGSSQKSQQGYCNKLVLNGKSDWRLPTVEELSTLPDRSKSAPAIDSVAFPNTPARWSWSSSPVVGHTSYAWGVHFNNGNVDFGDVGLVNVGSSDRVRCVR